MRSFMSIVLREAGRPGGVILAIVVGTTLTFTRRFESLALVLPFVVPYLVGLITRTTVRMANRRGDLLLDLPAYRKSPAFIMDCEGNIVAAAGETEDLFNRHGITRLDDLLQGPNDTTAGSIFLGDRAERPDYPLYSPVTRRWYRVQLRGDRRESDWLVWLDDVSEQVHLEEQKNVLRAFTRRLQQELLEDESASDDDTRLAQLLLAEGYQAVMLARLDRNDRPGAWGQVYTRNLGRPVTVRIPSGGDAPIMRSRRVGRAVHDDVASWASREEFEKTYQVLPEVAEILGGDVRNFANYHSGDVSIIAFNKAGTLGSADIAILESAADTAVTAFSLLELARRADRRFIQSIHGVCAAAEYSDELTGSHIWRVNDYSRHLAETLGLSPKVCEEIGTVAAMHDIGKVAIPHLIKLARALDTVEREEMQMHTIFGAQIIDRMRSASGESDTRLDMACEIALHHHQHWNGTGYPGLVDEHGILVFPGSHDPATYRRLLPVRGEAIPLPALIVSLADKYDALRSCRQYKPAFPHEKVRELLACDDRSGLKGPDVFGDRLYQAFMDTHQVLDGIYEADQVKARDETRGNQITIGEDAG
jgi:HD-GYP domain-containing protein (c-di-GMP phosphodiesterase class II)